MAGTKELKFRGYDKKEDALPLLVDLVRVSRIEIEGSNDVFEKIKTTGDAIEALSKNIKSTKTIDQKVKDHLIDELRYILLSQIDSLFYALDANNEKTQLSQKSGNKEIKKIRRYRNAVKKIEKNIIILLKRLYRKRNEKIRKGFGDHTIEITKFKLMNEKGNETNVFLTGQPFMAEISYVSHKKVERPMFGIAIHHENGSHICGPNNIDSGKILKKIKKRGKIIFRIDSLPLLKGQYLFSATAMNYETGRFYDFHWKEFKFSVFNGKIKDKYGLFYIPHSWEFK